jgi:ectoine hydroxylase-related dioxygenase (phytanoyl-CoA dioxygenase family)
MANYVQRELLHNGHVLVRNLASSSCVAEARTAIVDTVTRLANEIRDLKDRDTYAKAFLQVTNLWESDDTVKKFVFEKAFAQTAADLLGVDKVRLYHDQALFKEPGGGHTPWHQDKFYWPLDTDKMITMWMPLFDIDDEMGMITFASGSHIAGPVKNVEISDKSDEIYSRYVSDCGFKIWKPDSMKAGDATFHLGWTIHRAGPNLSKTMRAVMTVIYFADGACITEPTSKFQRADLEAWFPDQRPGEIARSRLNPVMN